ncbi:MAG: phosphotransferase [Candidatus Aureabacteria bacterium]|nr:phosphotransferase [Candidatus Auribacterota bacterium]
MQEDPYREKDILSAAADRLKVPLSAVALTRLAGDASTRIFYRAEATAENRRRSLVVARYPPGEGDGVARWALMAESLRAAGVGVPRVFASCPDRGYLLMEDCGDDLLQSVAASAPPSRIRSLYLRAVDELVLMQRMRPSASPGCPAWPLAFDAEKFLWELNFFLEHTVEGFWRARLSPADRRSFEKHFRLIVVRSLAQPFVFCHRDYHSRNLLVTRRGLKVIDFQDARRGPYTYDLASLLADPYVSLPESSVRKIKEYYLLRRPPDLQPILRKQFQIDFDMMSVQRLLKAAGTYGYMSRRGKKGYVRYLPAAMGRLFAILERYPDLRLLCDLLKRYAASIT